MAAARLRVSVTGAARQIRHSLVYSVAKGDVFGADQQVFIVLLGIEPMMGVLNGVVMEFMDCAFPTLAGVLPFCNPDEAFKDDVVPMLVGARPKERGLCKPNDLHWFHN